MAVAQASPPASWGGVPPPVCGPRTGTVLDPAAADGGATLRRQAVEVANEALVRAHNFSRGFQKRTNGLGGGGDDSGSSHAKLFILLNPFCDAVETAESCS